MFFLSGCSLYTHPKKITVKIPKKFKYALNNENFKIKNDWWKNFKSNKLDNIVSKALKNNLNYLIAIKNIKVAKTYVSQNESNLFPTVNFSYEATRNKMPSYQTALSSGGSVSGSSPTVIYNLNQAGLSASYELDVWNQVNNAVKQAKANVSVSKEDADVVKLTLISNVAQAYFQIQSLKESIVNLKKEYKAEKEILKLYEVQYKDGLTNAEPIVNTKTNLEILRTDLNDSIKQKDITQNTLAYYLGKFPENFKLSVKTNIKNVLNFNGNRYSKLIPPNIPSEILTQRPDVKEAEYNVLAYAYAKKESLANFFPVFNLTGSYGYASPSLNNFIADANSVWNFGLDILAPIFNYKTNISIYKRSKLQYQQAVLNYRNTIINAFSETDSDLADFQKDMQTLKSYEKNYRYALKLFNIYKVQYKTGISSKITYLTYKENLLNSEYNLINQNLLVKEDVINVYNALGMGLKD
ncbi:MAG: TolC family protein [Deltaproteobacteria bacterium]|nr:TolC family protein [Deltaproteobacteria bacterium]